VNFNPFYIPIKHIRICLYDFNLHDYAYAAVYNLIFIVILLFILKLIQRKKHELYLII
jgi:hypothetical protein